MNALTEKVGRLSPTVPTDTIVLIAPLPPVPAPLTRHPGGGRDTRRGAVTSVPRPRLRLTRRAHTLLIALMVVAGPFVLWAASRAFFQAVVAVPGWF